LLNGSNRIHIIRSDLLGIQTIDMNTPFIYVDAPFSMDILNTKYESSKEDFRKVGELELQVTLAGRMQMIKYVVSTIVT
jgi:hypothetical protein